MRRVKTFKPHLSITITSLNNTIYGNKSTSVATKARTRRSKKSATGVSTAPEVKENTSTDTLPEEEAKTE